MIIGNLGFLKRLMGITALDSPFDLVADTIDNSSLLIDATHVMNFLERIRW